MSVELRNLKGTRDFIKGEQRIRNEIIRKLQQIFENYGYQPIETPIICKYDILASKYAGGDEILKEVYKFKDQGQRDIGLRYDLTVPFARVVGMNPNIKMLFKRYEIGKVFRNGPVKTGRSREFIQCDVDMVGVKSMLAETELMIMASDIYKTLGLDVYISFNNRKLLSGIIKTIGVREELEGSVILSLDKLEKIGKGGVRNELIEKGLLDEDIVKLFSLLMMNESDLLEKLRSNPLNELIEQGIKELDELLYYIELLGIKDICRFTPCLARGLEIYTGTVFEIFLSDGSISSSLSGGGRYDKIIGAFLNNGNEYPAVGITFGLDVIYSALEAKGIEIDSSPVQVYIIPLGTEIESLGLLTRLRRQGISADIEMDKRKLRKSLEYAGKQEIPFVIVIGEDEIKNGKVRIKNMKESTDEEIDIDKIEFFFK
ncbi:histidine--tRNA ligase 1 [Clostridium polyendosporum]|uniref:Histidine--tRNA ligase n=1 Tax=Clostridium polyendosporum TaxID=69208 RepID=A0A919S2C6_9CLOT|nr:histidine--tRNA ligase [Clostridium polyendosporum]GIM30636.1 histidine--tRNA ligase 1 [Clostridium polyendosporum]